MVRAILRLEASAGAGAQSVYSWRRTLQLGLAALWMLDAVLQLQPMMFTRSFGTGMLLPTAQGNPRVVAAPMAWAVAMVGHNPQLADAGFAAVQLLVALGIAWRPTVRPALTLSVVWGLVVWWFGEGLGGLFAGTATPVTGAPGAALLYVLLAVLLWPHPEPGDGRSAAETRLGRVPARATWVLLWGGLGALTVANLAASRQVASALLAQTPGQPPWLAELDRWAASAFAHQGPPVMVGLCLALFLVAASTLLPRTWSGAGLALAALLAVGIWMVGEDFGGILSGSGTDPNSGPLLLLLILAYWPRGSAGSVLRARGESLGRAPGPEPRSLRGAPRW